MQLKQLAIRRKDAWEDKTRPLVGSVWFEGPTGEEVKINLDEATSARVVELCAEGIVNASRAVADILIQDMKLLK